jgi:hypothetical protein
MLNERHPSEKGVKGCQHWREIMAVQFLEMGKDSVGKIPSSDDDYFLLA